MNVPKNLVNFMRMFGVSVNNFSYSEIMKEVGAIMLEEETFKLRVSHHVEQKKLDKQINCLKE